MPSLRKYVHALAYVTTEQLWNLWTVIKFNTIFHYLYILGLEGEWHSIFYLFRSHSFCLLLLHILPSLTVVINMSVLAMLLFTVIHLFIEKEQRTCSLPAWFFDSHDIAVFSVSLLYDEKGSGKKSVNQWVDRKLACSGNICEYYY